MQIVGIIYINNNAPGLQLAKSYDVTTGKDWREFLNKNIDIVIETTGKQNVLNEIIKATKTFNTIVVPGSVAYIISELFAEKELLLEHIKDQVYYQQLILDNMHNGMIMINNEGYIQFLNERAEQIINVKEEVVLGKHINHVIKDSRLPQVLKNRRQELNQKVILENGRQIIS